MTHYLLRLCLPSKAYGQPAQILSEVHKDLPRWEYGWSRQLHGKPGLLYVLGKVCALPDEDCRLYNAWLENKQAHEDDVEAEHVRGDDVVPSG